jgi:hypothetical protein
MVPLPPRLPVLAVNSLSTLAKPVMFTDPVSNGLSSPPPPEGLEQLAIKKLKIAMIGKKRNLFNSRGGKTVTRN